jgi:hypothetical protein
MSKTTNETGAGRESLQLLTLDRCTTINLNKWCKKSWMKSSSVERKMEMKLELKMAMAGSGWKM